ncbi:P-loop containing nucleoside triphosphate hydrolase protein [Mycena pura]|uniref:P-loop containing nucleoside triphosphate hydrolase protein n=1 Tax=Mycena pura TaxID=153505 RepID=A0AAD6VEA4_9AGAR|nr:P-loop containing nucleoside triphosphate hydrolase protein [Mycena pura]
MGGVPSIPTDSSRRLQVIGAGYSRTGTVTMQLALENLLNGPILHGGTQILTREDSYCKNWVLAYRAKHRGDTEELHRLLRVLTAGFVGVTDMPPLDFIPELMEIYPEAKVVLTTRDPERWLQSIKPVARNSSLPWLPYLMWPIPGWRWFPSLSLEFGRSTRNILADGTKEANPKPSTRLLLNWNRMVREMVPPEKLLVMDLTEGWEPLCKFLEVPVPNEPLPKANDSDAASKAAKDITRRIFQIWAMGLGTVLVVAVGILRPGK